MSKNHKAQLQNAKADFVTKLTTWISQTPKHEPSKGLTEAGLMQRILDVHAYHEATTQNVHSPEINRYLMPRIKEWQFMKLRPISDRGVYVETLFGFFWKKNELNEIRAETRALVQQWLDYPKYQDKFPYSVLGTAGMRDNSQPKKELPKEEPKRTTRDAWDDDAWDDAPKVPPPPVKEQPPAQEFAAMAKEFGVPFQTGGDVGAAYKKLALLMHPDKHPGEEEVWTAKMKRLNALREALE